MVFAGTIDALYVIIDNVFIIYCGEIVEIGPIEVGVGLKLCLVFTLRWI